MDYYTIIIQLKLSDDNFGTEPEQNLLYVIEEYIDRICHEMNNGYCDGGQSGAGTMEIFLEQITDISLALDVVKREMIDLNLPMDYKIAWRLSKEGENWKVDFATNKNDLFSFEFFDFK